MESPVRLRATAILPGAPPHHWFLPACATLPFALEGVRCEQVVDLGNWPRQEQISTPIARLYTAPLRSWFGNLNGVGDSRLQVRSGAAGNLQPTKTPQGPRRMPSSTSQSEESLESQVTRPGYRVWSPRKKSLVPKSFI